MSSKEKLNEIVFTVRKKLPLKIYFAYGMGHVLNDVCAAIWFSYLLVYFQLVLKFSNNQAGVLLLIGQVADAVATPFVGYHSDKDYDCFFYRFGKRKIWYFIGTICVIVTFPFIFSPCVGCQTQTATVVHMVYYSIFIIIFQFGWAAVQISHMALIPEITPRENQRTKLAAIRNGATVFASIFVYLVAWGVLRVTEGTESTISPDDIGKFRVIVWSVMCFGIVCSIIFFLNIRELKIQKNTALSEESMKKSKTMDIFKNVNLYLVGVVYMSSRLFLNLTQVFLSLYLVETLGMVASALALVPLAMYIASFIAAIPVGMITKHVGRKVTYILGAVLGIVGCIWIHWGYGDIYVTYLIFVVVALLGSGTAIVMISSLDITTDLIGTKTNSGAFIYGIMSFLDKLTNGIAIELIQYFHGSKTNINYYRDVMTYATGGAVLLGSTAVIIIKNRKSYKEENQEETDSRVIHTIT